jgi:hypothetical protein
MAQTSGSVERLKWLPGLDRLFVHLDTGPATELFYVRFDDATAASRAGARAMSITLTRAGGAALPVVVSHGASDAHLTVVDLRAPAIRLSGFEITQAIQEPTHAVGLIATRRTVVRALLESAAPSALSVTGLLRVRRAGMADRLIAPAARALLDPVDYGSLAALRGSAAKTLNFVLPDDLVSAGTIEVSFEGLADAVGNPVPFTGGNQARTATFVAGTPLRIVIVGFTYTYGSPPQTHTPSQLDFDLLLSWLRRAYPASDVISAQRVVTATSATPFSCGQINGEVAQIRALDVAGGTDARTHYYGLVSDGGFFMRGCAAVPSSPNPAAVGSGPTGPASWGWDGDGSYGDWYGGHEIGHTFGRRHPGFCGETHDDPSYPYVLGQLADTPDSFVGFDVGDPAVGLGLAAMPGTSWHDVMTYCPQEWLSAYTYDGIRLRLAAEDALAPGPTAPGLGREDHRYDALVSPGESADAQPLQLVDVVATLNLKLGTGQITALLPVASTGWPSPEATGRGAIELRVLDPNVETIASYWGEPQPLSDLSEDATIDALLDMVIPLPPAAAVLQLLVDGLLADEVLLEDRAPEIQNLRVQDAEDGWLEVGWDGPDEPPWPSSYAVQVSRTRGRTWETVAVGLRELQTRIHPSNLPARGRILVRVLSLLGNRSVSAVAYHDRGETESLSR